MSVKGTNDRQVRNITILGLLFAAAGFIVIGVAWNGIASEAFADKQLPFLLSGGSTGVGLVIFGSALLVIGRMRAERLRTDARIEELIKATGRVGSAIASANGSENGLVVAGRSTYHRPDCRLVQGKELDKVTVEIASAAGLSACRVCDPALPDPSTAPKAAAAQEAPAKTTRKRSPARGKSSSKKASSKKS